jgi:hypothetical protein
MLAGLVHGLVDNSYFLMDLAVIFWLLCASMSFLVTSTAQEASSPAPAVTSSDSVSSAGGDIRRLFRLLFPLLPTGLISPLDAGRVLCLQRLPYQRLSSRQRLRLCFGVLPVAVGQPERAGTLWVTACSPEAHSRQHRRDSVHDAG